MMQRARRKTQLRIERTERKPSGDGDHLAGGSDLHGAEALVEDLPHRGDERERIVLGVTNAGTATSRV